MIIKIDKRLGSIEDRAQLRDQILLERKLDERFEKQEAEREKNNDFGQFMKNTYDEKLWGVR